MKPGDLLHVSVPSRNIDGLYLVTDVQPQPDGGETLTLLPDPEGQLQADSGALS